MIATAIAKTVELVELPAVSTILDPGGKGVPSGGGRGWRGEEHTEPRLVPVVFA